MNIFNFQGVVPHSHRHDISMCFSSSEMQHYTVSFPADTLTKVDNRRDTFLYSVMLALAQTGRVTPLRINRPEVISSKRISATNEYIYFKCPYLMSKGAVRICSFFRLPIHRATLTSSLQYYKFRKLRVTQLMDGRKQI